MLRLGLLVFSLYGPLLVNSATEWDSFPPTLTGNTTFVSGVGTFTVTVSSDRTNYLRAWELFDDCTLEKPYNSDWQSDHCVYATEEACGAHECTCPDGVTGLALQIPPDPQDHLPDYEYTGQWVVLDMPVTVEARLYRMAGHAVAWRIYGRNIWGQWVLLDDRDVKDNFATSGSRLYSIRAPTPITGLAVKVKRVNPTIEGSSQHYLQCFQLLDVTLVSDGVGIDCEVPQMNLAYYPINNVPGHTERTVMTIEQCQARCDASKGCAYWSRHRNGGCHLSNDTALPYSRWAWEAGAKCKMTEQIGNSQVTTSVSSLGPLILGRKDAKMCPNGALSNIPWSDCLEAVQKLLPHGILQGRKHLVLGSWRHVPPGCSVQSGGDWAAHFNNHPAPRTWRGYSPVCASEILGSDGSDYCPDGTYSSISETDCLAAVLSVLPVGTEQHRVHVVAGNFPWAPHGCSVQSGGDWAAHYNRGYGSNNGSFTLVCTLKTRPALSLGTPILGKKHAKVCPNGAISTIPWTDCLEAAQKLLWPLGIHQRRKHLVIGSWSHVAPGCSVQSGGDWAAHFNRHPTPRSWRNYSPVCASEILGIAGSDYCPDGTYSSISETDCLIAARSVISVVQDDLRLSVGEWSWAPHGCSVYSEGHHQIALYNWAYGINNGSFAPVCTQETRPEPASPAPRFLGRAASNVCPNGAMSTISAQDCLKAAQSLLPAYSKQGRTHLVHGGWRHVPPGCSIQSGGDWAAHYNYRLDGSGIAYTVVCTAQILGSRGSDYCPNGKFSSISVSDCLAAAQSILPLGTVQGRAHLVVGNFPWAPHGCSVQTGGDWAAHYNWGYGENDGTFAPACAHYSDAVQQAHQQQVNSTCSIPPKSEWQDVYYTCDQAKSWNCLNKNRGYRSLDDALALCKTEPECGRVSQFHNRKWYLRRLTDPVYERSHGLYKTIDLPCKEMPEEPIIVHGSCGIGDIPFTLQPGVDNLEMVPKFVGAPYVSFSLLKNGTFMPYCSDHMRPDVIFAGDKKLTKSVPMGMGFVNNCANKKNVASGDYYTPDYFLSYPHPNKIAKQCRGYVPSLLITYENDTRQASGLIWDIDAHKGGTEASRIIGFDARYNIIAEVNSPVGTSTGCETGENNWDGIPWHFVLRSPTNANPIKYIRIDHTGTKPHPYYTFSNFSVFTNCPVGGMPEQPMIIPADHVPNLGPHILGRQGSNVCPNGARSTISESECMDAVRSLLPNGTVLEPQLSTGLFGTAPTGCSVQSVGHWVALYNHRPNGLNDGAYSPVCASEILGIAGSDYCPDGMYSSISKYDCLKAVLSVLPPGAAQGRTNLVMGDWDWAPHGCSVQSGGDWAAHWNSGYGMNDGRLTPVCTVPIGPAQANSQCSVPPMNEWENVFYTCPEGNVANCLDGNRAHKELDDALAACSQDPNCGRVSRDHNKQWYLRRLSDPAVNESHKWYITIDSPCRDMPFIRNGDFDASNVSLREWAYTTPNHWTGSSNSDGSASGGKVAVVGRGCTWLAAPARGIHGTHYVILQGVGAYIKQRLNGLTSNTTYRIEFLASQRPRWNPYKAQLGITINGHPILSNFEPNGPTLERYSALFAASSSTDELAIINEAPPGSPGDQSVYIDNVRIVLVPPTSEWAVFPPTLNGSTTDVPNLGNFTVTDSSNQTNSLKVWELFSECTATKSYESEWYEQSLIQDKCVYATQEACRSDGCACPDGITGLALKNHSNHSNQTDWQPLPADGYPGEWIVLEMPVTVNATMYRLSGLATDWRIYGRNATGHWVLLDARTSVSTPWHVHIPFDSWNHHPYMMRTPVPINGLAVKVKRVLPHKPLRRPSPLHLHCLQLLDVTIVTDVPANASSNEEAFAPGDEPLDDDDDDDESDSEPEYASADSEPEYLVPAFVMPPAVLFPQFLMSELGAFMDPVQTMTFTPTATRTPTATATPTAAPCEWTEFSPCTKSCGGGISISRHVLFDDDADCPYNPGGWMERPCNTQACPICRALGMDEQHNPVKDPVCASNGKSYMNPCDLEWLKTWGSQRLHKDFRQIAWTSGHCKEFASYTQRRPRPQCLGKNLTQILNVSFTSHTAPEPRKKCRETPTCTGVWTSFEEGYVEMICNDLEEVETNSHAMQSYVHIKDAKVKVLQKKEKKVKGKGKVNGKN